MKLLFVALAIVATASAAVIQNPPHNPDNAKRNLQDIAKEIQGLIDTVSGIFNGGAKRNLQDIAKEIQGLIDSVSTIISGKRNLQTIAAEIQGLIDGITTVINSGKRDQDFDLVSLANTATQVIHALDVALNGGTGKRSLQTIATEIQALIDNVSHIFSGGAKRSLLTIAQELQGLIDSVTQAVNSGKRDQDFDLVSFANTAAQIIHAIDAAFNAGAKRNLQTIAAEIQGLIDGITTAIESGKRAQDFDLVSFANTAAQVIHAIDAAFNAGAKRNLQTIAAEIQGLIDGITTVINSGKRDQDFDLVSLANTATQVIHALDVALNGGTGKRSLQTIATEIQALIDNVSHIFSGGAKRSLLTIAQELQGLIDSVTQAVSSGKRDQDFDLVSFANTAAQVIHAIDAAFNAGGKRNLQTIAAEIQGLIDGITTAIESGKRAQDFDLVSLANTATQVIHALDVALNGGTGKRSLQTIATEIQALIDNVSHIFSGGAKRSLLTIAQELQGLIDSVTQAVSSGKRDQDFDLVSFANTAAQIIHAIDAAFNAGAKRNLQTIAAEIQGLIDGITTAIESGKRAQDFDLVSLANTATQVIHALDVAINGKRSLQTIATEIQALIDNVSHIFNGGAKRSLQTIATEIQALIDNVSHIFNGGAKRSLQTIATEIQTLIDNVSHIFNGGAKRSLLTIAQEIQGLIDGVTQAVQSG